MMCAASVKLVLELQTGPTRLRPLGALTFCRFLASVDLTCNTSKWTQKAMAFRFPVCGSLVCRYGCSVSFPTAVTQPPLLMGPLSEHQIQSSAIHQGFKLAAHGWGLGQASGFDQTYLHLLPWRQV